MERFLMSALIVFVLLSGTLISSAQTSSIPVISSPQTTFNVLDFGAKGNGITDDTLAFQNAIDEAGKDEIGAVVFVPRGNFLIKGNLIIKSNIILKGIWESPTARTQYKGSTLLAIADEDNPEGKPFITLFNNSTIQGITIFYPNQTMTNPPKAYPWTIAAGGADNCSIVDVLIVNPYQAVDFGSHTSGRHYIRNLYAQPLYKGLFIDQCYDVGRVENVHFWPFWGLEKPIQDFMEQNGTAFIIGKTDWEYMSNCFCILYNVGYHFISTPHGTPNALLTQCGSDVGPYAVIVEDCQAHAGISFLNSQIYGRVWVKETNMGFIRFTGCGFFGATIADKNETSHALLEGIGHASFDNCSFVTIDPKNNAKTGILIKNGSISVTDSVFMDYGKINLKIAPEVDAAVITGNIFPHKKAVEVNSKGDIQIALNSFKEIIEEKNAIVIDNTDDKYFKTEGEWHTGQGGKDYMGNVHWAIKGKGECKAYWKPKIKKSGYYSLYIWYGGDPMKNHATNAKLKINSGKGDDTKIIDLTKDFGKWIKLGDYYFRKDKKASVMISNDADNNIVADAIKLIPKKKNFLFF